MFHSGALTSQRCASETCFTSSGYLAVDMFFLLSGFVISYSYGHRLASDLSFLVFMRARVIRLYPIYFFSAVVGALPFIYFAFNGQGSRGRLLITLATNFLLLPAPTLPVQPDPFPLDSPAWSLFFELFVANIGFGLLYKRLTNGLLAAIILVSFAILVAIVACMGTINGGWLWKDFLVGFPRIIFSFSVGVAIHRLFLVKKAPSLPSGIVLMMAAAMFWPRFHGWLVPAYEILCISFVFPLIIYFGSCSYEKWPHFGKVLGELSYPLYLIHIPVLLILLQLASATELTLGGSRGMRLWFICTTVSVLLAWFLAYRFDRPARKFLRRILVRGHEADV